MTSQSSRPYVSVIITTYKAVDHLFCCVRSLLREVASPCLFEVVLYGDGGGFQSEQMILQLACELETFGIGVKVFYNPKNLGICPALNAAAKMASGSWFFFVNDDMVFPKHWMSIVSPLLKPNRVLSLACIEPPLVGRKMARCFYASNLGLNPLDFSFEKLDDFQSSLLASCSAETLPLELGVNYPFFIEADAFWSVGGVDEMFPGPYHDPDLFLRLRLRGAELLRCRFVVLYHFSGVSFRFASSDSSVPKVQKKSRYWVVQENKARLLFLKKWGVKPKTPFGFLPPVQTSVLLSSRKLFSWFRAKFFFLYVWELLRIRFRELFY